MEDFSMNTSSEGGVSSVTFVHPESKELPSCIPAATIDAMACTVKKKRTRYKKKKKIMDNSSHASEDINNEIIYEPDKWSPTNLEGKKKYGRRFLLRFRFYPVCLKKPDNLIARSDLSEIVLENCMEEETCPLCSCRPPDSKLVTTKNCADSVMKTTEALEKEVTFKIVPDDILMKTPSLAEIFFCDSRNLNEAGAYTVLHLEKVTVMPLTIKTEIPLTSNEDLVKPQNPVELKKYDREFLLNLRSHPLSLKQPESLTYQNVMKPNNPNEKVLDSIFKRTPGGEPVLLEESSTSSALHEPSFDCSSQNSLDVQQGSEGKCKWKHDSILLLIQAYKEEEPKIKSGQISKKKAWQKITEILQAKGITTCYADCRGRMNVLKKQYESMLNLKDGNDKEREKWPYFELLDDIFSQSQSGEPVLPSESTIQASVQESSTSSISNGLPSVQTLDLGKQEGLSHKDRKPFLNAWKKEKESIKKNYDLELQRQNQLLEEMIATANPSLPVSSANSPSHSIPDTLLWNKGQSKGLSHEDMNTFFNSLEKERENFKEKHVQELKRRDQLLEEMLNSIHPSVPESSANSGSHSIPDMLRWNRGPCKIFSGDDIKNFTNATENCRKEWREQYRQLLLRQDQLLSDISQFLNE